MHEIGLSKNQIFEQLSKSTHRNYEEYVPATRAACRLDPGFLAHLISWNRTKGQIRDSKVALPVASLSCPEFTQEELVENSMAHILALRPRELARAVRFSRQVKIKHNRALRRNVLRFLRGLEANMGKFDRIALQHRRSLKELYAFPYTGGSLAPSEAANVLLQKRKLDGSYAEYPLNSLRAVVSSLKDMSPLEAAGTIISKRIPFLVASGAMGKRFREPEILMALVERMTPAELTNNAAMLVKAGIKNDPSSRAAFEKALVKSVGSSKDSALKMSKAVEAIEDEELKVKLSSAQEKKLDAIGIDGNWLVIGDQSGSMSKSIELARELASTLARLVKGTVHLIFVNTLPTHFNVSGKSLDEVKKLTKFIVANGGTSLGCGLQYAVEQSLDVDGVAIVSDGGENNAPGYFQAHAAYEKKFGKNLPTYLYRLPGDADALSGNCARAGIQLQTFDASRMDYYSIPNIAQTMRTNRYSLIDEVMACPLITVDQVLNSTREAATV